MDSPARKVVFGTLSFFCLVLAQDMAELYSEVSTLIWNGYRVQGKANIHKWLMDLPPTQHVITGIDVQPIVLGTFFPVTGK